MIKVDVHALSHNVDVIEVQVEQKVTCADLIAECKTLLNLSGDIKYALKQNDIFIHPMQTLSDGDSFLLTLAQQE